MSVLVIIAHPDPESFNHAIAATVLDTLSRIGLETIYHDLYGEGFEPLLSAPEIPGDAPLPPRIAAHCDEIANAESIVVVHPNWWGQPPAILKGWIDRVIRPGVAYEFVEGDSGEGVPHGLLRARAATVFNTSNTEASREKTVFGDPLEAIWRDCIFGLCGVARFYRRMFSTVVTSTPQQRTLWLSEVRDTINSQFGQFDQ